MTDVIGKSTKFKVSKTKPDRSIGGYHMTYPLEGYHVTYKTVPRRIALENLVKAFGIEKCLSALKKYRSSVGYELGRKITADIRYLLKSRGRAEEAKRVPYPRQPY